MSNPAPQSDHTAVRLQNDTRFAALMNNDSILAWMQDLQGQYVYVSPRFAHMLQNVPAGPISDTEQNRMLNESRRANAATSAAGPAFPSCRDAALPASGTIAGAAGEPQTWQIVEFPFHADGGELLVGGMAVNVTACARVPERLHSAGGFAQSLADNSPSLLYVFDLATRTNVYHNRDVCEFLGCTPEQTQAQGAAFLPAVVHPDDLAHAHAHLGEFACMSDAQVSEVETRIKHADGTYHWVWIRARVFERDADGAPVRILGIGQDVTERRHATEQLALRQHLAQQVAFSSPAILYIYDLIEQRSIYNNREVAPALGYSAEQMRDMGAALFATIMHPDDIGRVVASNARYAQMQDGEVLETEYRMRHVDGSWRWFYSRNTIFLRDANGVPTQIIGSAQDVTERKGFEAQIEEQIARVHAANVELEAQRAELAAANAKLQALATTDGLTGLKNHRAFQEFLNAEFGRAARSRAPYALILLDVDNFKQYNDTYGHPAGDTVLKAVAQRLQALTRSIDMVARYGGEEFVVVLPGTDRAGALAVGERLRQSIEAYDDPNCIVTASLGVATWTPCIARAALLVEQADQALYASKRQGRNRVSHFEPVAGKAASEQTQTR